jgi:hypothetical protein
MPRFIDCVQGSQAWFDCRAGHATASRFADILSGKAARESYLYELVAERLAGPLRDGGGRAKEWGHESEDHARRAYTIRTGELVQQVGFAVHSKILWCGASSDGLVGDDGSLEIKSPFNSGVHAKTLALGMPEEHYWQVVGNIWILGRKWLDFASYDPAYKAPYDLYVQRFERDETAIKHLEVEVKKFLAEVAIAVKDIKSKYH